jgi:hypothetical protein
MLEFRSMFETEIAFMASVPQKLCSQRANATLSLLLAARTSSYKLAGSIMIAS